jgi:hypothetical protein
MSTHIAEIYDKLTKIIIDRVGSKCDQAKQTVDWETMIAPDKLPKDYYLNTIVVDLISMHNILVKVLSAGQLTTVYKKILMQMEAKLRDLYTTIDIATAISAQRVRNDMHSLILNLREKLSVHL